MRELDQLRNSLTTLVQQYKLLQVQVRQQQTTIKSQADKIAQLDTELQSLKQQGMDALTVSAMADSDKISLQHNLDLVIGEIDRLLGQPQA
jgi:chromosome segregation ATPase